MSFTQRLLAPALFALLSFGTISTLSGAATVVINVDGAIPFQRLDGFGSSERVFDDPHVFNNFNPATARAATVLTRPQQDEVLDRLYLDLKLTRVRPACPETSSNNGVATGIEPLNDNTDTNSIDWSKFDFGWKNLDAHMDYISRARQRGVTTFFLSPLNRELWMSTSTTNDAAEYAEWLFAQALRCYAQGVTLPYLSIANEPSYSRNTLPGHFMANVIKILGPRLRAAGLNTLFVVPDDVRSSDAAVKAGIILSDPLARPYVGALATHLYDESVTNVNKMKALAEQYSLPLWMSEFSLALAGSIGSGNGPFDWADLIHELLWSYNVSGIDYQWGFFGQWESGSQFLSLNYNTSGAQAYTGYTLKKEYYVTGQWSRFIKPGAQRVKSDSTNGVKVTAFKADADLVVVAFNRSNTAQTVEFHMTGVPNPVVAQPVRTSATENWAALSSIPVTASSFTTTLPAQSVTTFTLTASPSNAAPSVTLTNPLESQRFTAGTNLTLSADVSDDGSVAKVEFFQGTNLLGEGSSSPYRLTWTNVASGNYTFTARATDNGGITTLSRPVSISVVARPQILLVASTNGLFRLNVALEAGRNYTLEFSTDLLNWSLLQTQMSAGGTYIFDDTNGFGFPARFYRVKVD